MKNSDYWKGRFELLEAASNRDGASVYHDIEGQYMAAQRQLESQIQSWYQRFATNNKVTMAEARKMLNAKELAELKWDVKEYIKYGEQLDLNPAWMQQLENASARYHISRLEALKLQTQQSVEVLFGNQTDEVDSLMKQIYSDGYYHTAYEIQKGFNVGWDIASIDQGKLEKIISKPWAADGKNFSDRIWTNKQSLISELHTQLTQTCILGKAPDDAIKNIAKKMNTSKNNAGRLIMTESAYFSSVSQKDCFNDLDVKRFEVVATLDSHTSAICQEMDGKVFPMKDYEPGVTAPPFHVWCRSCTVPYFDDEFNIGERAARGEDGKTYYVPDSMKYPDWKKSMVDGDTDGLTIMDDEHRSKLIESIRQKDIWNGLPNEKRDIIINAIKKGDVSFIEMAEQSMGKCHVMWDIDSEATAHYRHSTGNITMTKQSNDIDFAQTFWHEYGHFMDDANVSGSEIKIVTTTTSRKGEITEWTWRGASSVAERTGYENAMVKDVTRLLDDCGLSDDYYIHLPKDEYNHPWLYKKVNNVPIDVTSDYADVDKLQNALKKRFDDYCGVTKSKNYLIDIGYPQNPNYSDFFEFYTTPKRKTVKTKPKFKGAESAWQKALDEAHKAQETFEATHDMDAIWKEKNKLYEVAVALEDKLGWVSDTIDGSVYGAFNSQLLLGGHSASYYMTNDNGIKEGIANVFMGNITGDNDVLDAFEEICPELHKVMKGAWKHGR